MGPKCYAVQCIINGEENPQTVPFPWDFVTLPEKDWTKATACRILFLLQCHFHGVSPGSTERQIYPIQILFRYRIFTINIKNSFSIINSSKDMIAGI